MKYPRGVTINTINYLDEICCSLRSTTKKYNSLYIATVYKLEDSYKLF